MHTNFQRWKWILICLLILLFVEVKGSASQDLLSIFSQLRRELISEAFLGQVFDKVNAQGIHCNLHTGQEKKDVLFANHLACTVEMSYLNKQWEVAVIDEVQVFFSAQFKKQKMNV